MADIITNNLTPARQLRQSLAIGNYLKIPGDNAVTIGYSAGYTGQGDNAVSIGAFAGFTAQSANSIVINASGSPVSSDASGCYINPVRPTADINNFMVYNTYTNEVNYNTTFTINSAGELSVTVGSKTYVFTPSATTTV